MESYPKKTEKYKRKEPPGILFLGGSLLLLAELLPIQYKNIWTALGISLIIIIIIIIIIFIYIIIYIFVVIDRLKGWYYTKWI
ncbi:hypothetical protein, partial [Peribacillus sp. NPDC058002]|uniref:hypothetical protein n=1 Tax=Peribacillus sp. NPDC058002 TaxID=3346301 RepID=UPI0036D7D48A